MEATQGPIIAASDYMKVLADQVAPWLRRTSGRIGDRRLRPQRQPALSARRFFEVDAESIASAALSQLARWGQFDAQKARQAVVELGIDADKKEAAKN